MHIQSTPQEYEPELEQVLEEELEKINLEQGREEKEKDKENT